MTHDTSRRLYTERTVLFAKPETVIGQDALPTAQANAFLVGQVELNIAPQILERDIYSPSFSPIAGDVGRTPITLSFTHEIKGSGAVGVRSKLGELLTGCRMQERLIVAGAATQIETAVAVGETNGPNVTWGKTDAPASIYGSYLIVCSKGGASATAEFQVFRWNQGALDATVPFTPRNAIVADHLAGAIVSLNESNPSSPVYTIAGAPVAGDNIYAVVGGMVFHHKVAAGAVTPTLIATALAARINSHALFNAVAAAGVITVTFITGAGANAAPVIATSGTTKIPLGASGAAVTPTWAGNLVAGQSWVVHLHEPGYVYAPISGGDEETTFTFYTFIDGQLFIITAALGTVTFTGTAGEYGSAAFEFTGQFHVPKPQPLPRELRYELTKPPKCELAQMSIRGVQDFCAESFTITLANDISERLCLNAKDGYAGSEITGRSPTASMNPEGSLEIYTNMWGDFVKGEEVPIHLRVGTRPGNTVRFYANNATYTQLTMSDRNGAMVQEPTFQLNGLSPYGDDELLVCFP